MLEGPPTLACEVFEKTYCDWIFDEALQHVAVRPLIFGAADAAQRAKQSKTGRRDMEFLFSWLREKKVRHIIKLIICDFGPFPPHSDESIETALAGFIIEILDWRKLDMCPMTIQVSCPNVSELHLWWSGNNAILRAWSAEGGLAELQHLRQLYIHQISVSTENPLQFVVGG